MTELFGGFSAVFYAAYREAYPLDPGYAIRKTLYNLYHILNHLNLFGGGYRHQAEQMMGRLLAEILRYEPRSGMSARITNFQRVFLRSELQRIYIQRPSHLVGGKRVESCPPCGEIFL